MGLKFLTVRQVSRKTGLPSFRVRVMADNEEFPSYVELEGVRRFIKDEVEEWMQRRIDERDDREDQSDAWER
jgi:predicted DNA-binding transcriptional regulator AlpA